MLTAGLGGLGDGPFLQGAQCPLAGVVLGGLFDCPPTTVCTKGLSIPLITKETGPWEVVSLPGVTGLGGCCAPGASFLSSGLLGPMTEATKSFPVSRGLDVQEARVWTSDSGGRGGTEF